MPEPRKRDPEEIRRRVAEHRDRLRAKGLKPVQVWIKPEDEAAVRAYDARKEKT